MNIMDMVKGAISDQVMGQLGKAIGLPDQNKAASTFETGIGSILGGLIKKSASSEGAKQVFDAASNADDGIMDKLGDILGGGGDQVQQVQQSGGKMLEGLFGKSQGGMTQMIAKALGLDESLIGKLLMMAAPMLLGAIGKHIKTAGLDALGLGKLMGEQKQYLGASLPSGLSQNLGFGNLLSDAQGMADNVGASAMNSVGNARDSAASAVNDAAGAGGGLLKILLPLFAIAAIGYAVWLFTSGKPDVDPPAGGGGSAIPSIDPSAAIGGAGLGDLNLDLLGDKGKQLQEGMSGITTGFTNLKDSGADGANQLATKITDFTSSIDNMGLGDLPDTAKPVAKTMIGKFMDTVQGMLDKQSPAIKGILQKVVDTLFDKLKPFA